MQYFDQAETFSRDRIAATQAARLRATLERVRRSPFYDSRLSEAGVTPESVRSADDITAVPFTLKDDLRAQYPDGLLTMPVSSMVRMHASSGTTGSPTAVMYTQNDLNCWADLMARSMHACGVRSHDIFQNSSGYGLFTGGLGIHYGAERLGCMTIPAGAGNTLRQIKLIRDFKVSVLHVIPSYALYLAQAFAEHGADPADLNLRIALVGAEPHTDETRRRIEEMLHLKAYNSYGLSEMNGPGVAFECECQDGMHVWEDAYIPEIINPETGEALPDGEVGELVLTTLCREGMPILRYRTRDLTRIIPGDCACGRKHRRIDRIMGRADDMLIIKGVNIYPMQVEQVLMAFPEVGQNYLIELTREGVVDHFTVKVEMHEEFFVEDMRVLNAMRKRIASRLRDEILITPRVELVQQNSLPKSEGKAKRVVDLREN